MNKYLLALVLLFFSSPAFALLKSGDSFNAASDVNWGDIEFKFLGICICPRPPPIFYEEGEIYEYWDPSLFIDTYPPSENSIVDEEVVGLATEPETTDDIADACATDNLYHLMS